MRFQRRASACPTSQLRGDELDGPRGRIYQMKQYFEGEAANARMLKHLDRCLTCRSCETTCPSGVRYGRLVDIGREIVEQRVREIARSILSNELGAGGPVTTDFVDTVASWRRRETSAP